LARADIHSPDDREITELAMHGRRDPNLQVIEVVLSERNLLSLFSKLFIEDSARTLYNGDVPDGYVLKLVAEDDDTHYESPTRMGARAGFIHPDTQNLVNALYATVEEWQNKRKVVSLFNESVKNAQGA